VKKIHSVVVALFFCVPTLAQPRALAWENGNCWLSASVQMFFNMPELMALLCPSRLNLSLGKDSRYDAVAKSLVTLLCDMKASEDKNGYVLQMRDLQGKIAIIDPGCVGSSDAAEVTDTILLQALEKVSYLWGFDLDSDDPVFYKGQRLFLAMPDKTFGWQDLIRCYMNRWLSKSSPTLDEARKKNLLLLTAVGPYIFIHVPPTDDGHNIVAQPNGTLLPTIDISEHVIPAIRQKAGGRLLYDLIGFVMDTGGHSVAYVKDQYDPAQLWYKCDTPGLVVKKLDLVKDKVLGEWKGFERPRVLVYRVQDPLEKLAQALKSIAKSV